MPEAGSRGSKRNVAFICAIALFALTVALFVFAVLAASAPGAVSHSTAIPGAFADDVLAALDGALAEEGDALVAQYGCIACHVLGDRRIAPRFAGIANRAGARRPPLSAEQYLFESIVDPGLFRVEAYANAMPANYADRLSREEIGHIIAFLLTLTESEA